MSLVHSGNRMVLQSRFPQKQEGGVLWTGISGIVSALAWSPAESSGIFIAFTPSHDVGPGRTCPRECEGGRIYINSNQTRSAGWCKWDCLYVGTVN